MEKENFQKLKIGIAVVSLIIAIITKSDIDLMNLQNNYIDPVRVNEIVYDLSVGVFSAMILVFFIDEIGEKIEMKQSREDEKAIIQRFNKVILLYIDRYTDLFYAVITPLQDRDYQNICWTKDFKLRDMRDLYETSTYLSEKISAPSVEAFLNIELTLRTEFISLIEKHDFKYYPQFTSIFLGFIQFSLCFDCRDFILDVPNKITSTGPMKDTIHDMLEVHADDFLKKNLNKTNVSANLAHPYICLYRMMQEEWEYILKYLDEIKKLG